MTAFFLLGLSAALILMVLEGAWLARLPPAKVKKLLQHSLYAGGSIVLIGLVVTGVLHWIFAVFAVVLPFWKQILNGVRKIYTETRKQRVARTRAPPNMPLSMGMSREQAYRILGLPPGASIPQIKDAHRKLMRKAHPDRGGSSDLAAQINRAKDVLLNE